MLTRPSLAEVLSYRAAVDAAMLDFIGAADADSLRPRRHGSNWPCSTSSKYQELLLTDALALLALNPLAPALRAERRRPSLRPRRAGWHPGGEVMIGHDGNGFAFDNETPRHRVTLQPFEAGHRPVTNAEYQAFVDDGGYRRPSLWLSDGWAMVQAQGWAGPAYWRDGGIVSGCTARRREASAPVLHPSFYEAAAYAEWAGARLPTEFEWGGRGRAECAAGAMRPGPARQWTRGSSYDPTRASARGRRRRRVQRQVHGRPDRAARLEPATPPGHARRSYRNFFRRRRAGNSAAAAGRDV